MNGKPPHTGEPSSSGDMFKWLLVTALLVGGVVAHYYFSDVFIIWRLLAWIALAVVVFFIAGQTQKGKQALAFANEAKIEIRRVVWPTRSETLQTTLIVVVAVIITALLLWALDAMLFRLMTWFTGYGG